MLLWVLSDLHLEATRRWDLPSGDARPHFDVLVMAGDLITRMERGVKWLSERVTDRPVIYVAGNHEAYGADLDRTIEKARAAAVGTNIHILQNDSVTIGGTIFLGATGWTDFNLFGNADRAMQVAGEVMNDYKKIRIKNYEYRLRPAHTLARHLETRAYFQRELSRQKILPRVVVTHMGFHTEAARRGFERDLISAAYTSDNPIEGADLWVYGHTHESRDFRAGTTRVVSNAKGYGPWRAGDSWENPHFDPNLIVEI
ncbi:Calcineurin-like phosphoesterase [Afipia felis]|uniref:Calcineurin-like phosphoesterase n=1 Tax=Afipia felis TaxID=1035 RepID=A0A090MS49_AFIFE|nr:metallophosphoesterase [Afipia felis]CEG10166.1 Calcineurin-like phosphoesterase [Afipia felis]